MTSSVPDIAPYFDLHSDVRGPGDQRPTAMQIIRDQNLFGRLGHLNILVTGGNSGIGREAVKALHTTGARIWIALAPEIDGESVAREIENSNGNDSNLSEHKITFQNIEAVAINLASLTSIRAAAAEVKRRTSNRLNILICNAGVLVPQFQETEDGFEPHFGINYLGHFLLFNELAEALAGGNPHSKSSASRVVFLSSHAHKGADVDVSKLPPNNPIDSKTGVQYYCESKTEILWMANEIQRRFNTKGILGLSVNPGSIVTPLTAHIGWGTIREGTGKDIAEFDRLTKSLEQGAATTVWAAVGKELENKGGLYLEDVQVARAAVEIAPMFAHGYAPWAYDESKARQLWDITVNVLRGKGFDVAVSAS